MKSTIYCGFSANPEIHHFIEKGSNGKNPIVQKEIYLSGSTINIASCLQNMGHVPHSLILTAVEDGILNNIYSDTLVKLLFREQFQHTHYKILTEPNYAYVRHYIEEEGRFELDSNKGILIPELISGAIHKIQDIKDDINWAICTGLQLAEKDLAITLFSRAENGKRVLVPKPELIANGSFKDVLRYTDLVIMNESEFKVYPDKNPLSILDKGVKILVITKDSLGGEVYTKEGSFDYNPFYLNKPIKSAVGSGDWFTGAFVSFCEENNDSLVLSTEKLKEVINFAAQVAAKKLEHIGGSNGPKRKDIT